MASVVPTPSELQSLSLACRKLWDLDSNRLEPGVDYAINLQDGKSAFQKGDVADEPLFTFVDPCVFERRTFKLFYDLLDNYERGTGIPENVTPEELTENNEFLNAIIETAPMRYAYNWLVKNKKFSGDIRAFKKKLDFLWFGLYRRETCNDSSGFEHVFVGEERDGKVMGCHNWIQLYNEERQGRLNYHGYIHPKQRGRGFMEPHDHEQLVTIQFKWDREIKLVSTSLIGVSPEFELALYSMCFINGKEDNAVELGPYYANIKCYTFGRGQNTKIGTAFPEALPLTEKQAAVRIQASFRGRRVRTEVKTTFNATSTSAWGPPPGQAPPASAQTQPEAPPAPGAGAWGQPKSFASVIAGNSPTPAAPAPAAGGPAPAPPSAQGAWGQPRTWH